MSRSRDNSPEPDARELEAADVHARWMAAMHANDFEAAWQQTDRLELPRRQRERAGTFIWEPQHLLWNGEAFAGRRVLVRCNHGLGDTLQFVRFLPAIRAMAESVTVWAQPALVPLLQLMPEFGNVQNGWTEEPPPPHDMEIEVMELAYALRRTAAEVSGQGPYLTLERIRAHRPPLVANGVGFHATAGLLWAASGWNPRRSIPLGELAPLAAVPGCRFYSLQQGAEANDACKAPFPLEVWSPHTKEILAAAAAMLEMDLIITVDSMAAHLAGALGRPVWLLLQHEADWRWGSDLERTPWYPTMRLFRQPAPGAWRAVGEQVAASLRAMAEG